MLLSAGGNASLLIGQSTTLVETEISQKSFPLTFMILWLWLYSFFYSVPPHLLTLPQSQCSILKDVSFPKCISRTEEIGGLPEELWARIHKCSADDGAVPHVIFNWFLNYIINIIIFDNWYLNDSTKVNMPHYIKFLLPWLLSPCVSSLLPLLASEEGGTKTQGEEARNGGGCTKWEMSTGVFIMPWWRWSGCWTGCDHLAWP